MRTLFLSTAALLLLLCAAPLHAQTYQRLTNAEMGAGCASSRGGSPAIFPMVYPFNAASLQFTIFIPNDPTIVGVNFYNQCVFVDTMALPLYGRSVTVSNAMEGVVGN